MRCREIHQSESPSDKRELDRVRRGARLHHHARHTRAANFSVAAVQADNALALIDEAGEALSIRGARSC